MKTAGYSCAFPFSAATMPATFLYPDFNQRGQYDE